MLWVFPKPLCILFSDTKGIQWVDTDATHGNDVMYNGAHCVDVTLLLSRKEVFKNQS